MSFKITGIKEVQKKLRDLQHSVDPRTTDEWANRISRTAKQLCNDPQCKRIRLTKTGQGRFNIEIVDKKDKEAFDCVINSIRRHLYSMPDIQKELYRRILTRLESEKRMS